MDHSIVVLAFRRSDHCSDRQTQNVPGPHPLVHVRAIELQWGKKLENTQILKISSEYSIVHTFWLSIQAFSISPLVKIQTNNLVVFVSQRAAILSHTHRLEGHTPGIFHLARFIVNANVRKTCSNQHAKWMQMAATAIAMHVQRRTKQSGSLKKTTKSWECTKWTVRGALFMAHLKKTNKCH